MDTDNTRRCCEPGCEARCLPPRAGWYHVGAGFMCWACPEHTEVWRALDQQRGDYARARGEAYLEAEKAFEVAWEAVHGGYPKRPQQSSLLTG